MRSAWRSMRPGPRALLAAAALVVVVNVVVAGVTTVTGGSGPGGPTSSSYATGHDGLGAFAELLARRGHPVQRLRVSLARAALDPAATLVLADPRGVMPGESRALGRFLEAGGRLVAGGATSAPALRDLAGGGPEWDDATVRSARPLVPVAEVAGVATVEAAGTGAWAATGGFLPVLGGPEGVVAAVAHVGQGRAVALADVSPLHSRLLARADNAALGLGLVGEPGRPVTFSEAHHGYGRGTGLAALPSRWRWAFAGALVAALGWMWSRGRPFGPPDEVDRADPPARRAYADAMAAALARTGHPDAVVSPLRERARGRLAQRGGLPRDAPDDALRRVATDLGLAGEEVDALFRPCHGEREVVALGRAAARVLERGP